MGAGVDHIVRSLGDVAEMVVELRPLQTGLAHDVDGILTTTKQSGRWLHNATTSLRYKITNSGIRIVS